MQISDLVYIDDSGYHFADYPAFLAWRQDQFRAIYGNDINLDPDTQDGQLVAIQAKADYDTAALGAAIYNSFSPVTAQGTGLSRVVKINGLRRGVPTNSQVDLTIVGTYGTIIKDGVAIDVLKQKWNLPATVTIPFSGTITVTATAADLGAITADPNTIQGIFTPTLGWQTVDNAAAAVPGAPIESDAELRIRQQRSTANPSLTVLDGTWGALENLDGVTKVWIYENDTGAPDGNGIPAHSVACIVKGGSALDVANTIALHKTPGASTYGTTTETVYDAHGMPLDINFYRPTDATIDVRITLAAGQGWSSDFEQLIKDALAATVNAIRIGGVVQITKLYPPAYLPGTPAGGTFDISQIELQKNGGGYGTTNISLLFNEDAVCDANLNVTVIVT